MTTTTTAPAAVAPDLDDPISFAHSLYRDLAAADDPRLRPATGPAYRAFQEAIRGLRAAELSPDAADASDQVAMAAHDWTDAAHAAGVAFRVAAETLRRSLVASAGSRAIAAPDHHVEP
ncbi:MAG: hypothetical protein M3R02_23385 [Chloroflexota bacterium]|nr:hypothetical protein [Chloroflexota bacterium]